MLIKIPEENHFLIYHQSDSNHITKYQLFHNPNNIGYPFTYDSDIRYFTRSTDNIVFVSENMEPKYSLEKYNDFRFSSLKLIDAPFSVKAYLMFI